MNLNENIIKGKWKEMKGEVQKLWGKITDDELEKTKGDVNSIAGLVQQKHGEGKEAFQKKFSSIMDKFIHKKDKMMDDVKDKLK